MNLMDRETLLATELTALRQQHRQLDAEISDLSGGAADRLMIQRMKKKKLALKDRISRIEDQLYPDIIA